MNDKTEEPANRPDDPVAEAVRDVLNEERKDRETYERIRIEQREAAQRSLIADLAKATLQFVEKGVAPALAELGMVLTHELRRHGPGDQTESGGKWLRTAVMHKDGGFLEVVVEVVDDDIIEARDLANSLLLNLNRKPADAEPEGGKPPGPIKRRVN